MKQNKCAVLVGGFLCIMVCVWLGGMAYQKAKLTGNILFITKPLYINNKLNMSNEPLVENSGERYICADLCDLEIIDSVEKKVIDGRAYISFSSLKDDLGWNINETENAIFIDNFQNRFDYSWTEYSYIAHACGMLDNNTYTNSLEAFLANYNAGHRVFEVDFSLTSDQKLVALHDWSEETVINTCGFSIPQDKIGEALTREEFLQLKVKGQYTPLSFEDIISLLKEYPDVYIVTDTKETEEPYISQQFQYMVDAAKKDDPVVLERIIPQIYNEEMFDIIMGIYDWNSIIYTLYKQDLFGFSQDVIDFSYRNGIKVITVNESRASDLFFDELRKRGQMIYMHTYNTESAVEYWRTQGVYGFYTDYLKP